MPSTALGQQITFAVELDSAHTYANFTWYTVKKAESVAAIAAKYGHPEMAAEIGRLNGIRDITKKLQPNTRGPRPVYKDFRNGILYGKALAAWYHHGNRQLKLPGTLNSGDVLNVLADDPPPLVTDGYAKYDTVDRPGRLGVNRFLGYNPIVYEVPIQFEAWTQRDRHGHPTGGADVERAIQTLERMAGRGAFAGAATGPPAVVRISVTDNTGAQNMLIPFNYQWSKGNPHAPLWRISNIAWDKSPLRHTDGRRLRQRAVVTVQEYTPITVAVRSATARHKSKPKKKKKK